MVEDRVTVIGVCDLEFAAFCCFFVEAGQSSLELGLFPDREENCHNEASFARAVLGSAMLCSPGAVVSNELIGDAVLSFPNVSGLELGGC